MSKTYEEILQGLKDAFETNAAAWGDLTGYLKTTQSKFITLQDWNTLIALLGRTDAYIRAMYPLISGLGDLGTSFKDDVSDIRSDTELARDAAILAKTATEEVRDEVASKTITEVSIMDDGRLCFTFEDGSTAVTESSVIGPQGPQGIQGPPFMISKTFSSVDEMHAGAATDGVLPGQYVAIDTNVEYEDSAKVFMKREDGTYTFVVDLSGKEGIQGPKGDSVVEDLTLPDKWYTLNDKIAANAGNDGHPIMGGLVYKAMDGSIKVFPLAPAYGVRVEEAGEGLSTVALYNSAQQLLCKPATDGRHTICLEQLGKLLGCGPNSGNSILPKEEEDYPQPVDTSVPTGERIPYVFCRDTNNVFTSKPYSVKVLKRSLVERDDDGGIAVRDPVNNFQPVTFNSLGNVCKCVFRDKYVHSTPSNNTAATGFADLEIGKSYTLQYLGTDGIMYFTNTVLYTGNNVTFTRGTQTTLYDGKNRRWQFNSVDASKFTRNVTLQEHDTSVLFDWVKSYVDDAIKSIPNAKGVGF